MIFGRRNVKKINKPIEKRTIPELIESVEHVSPMNIDSIVKDWNSNEIARKFPKFNKGLLKNDSYWMNPYNQECFESGHLTHQDFIDWANGTGKVVRGKTQEHKDMYMRTAKAERTLDLSLSIYLEHLWMIDSESKTKWAPKYRKHQYSNPINMSNRKDSTQIIKEVYSEMVQLVYRDIKDQYEWHGKHIIDESKSDRDWLKNMRANHREFMHGVCHTLAIGGHGYYDACNIPCELENLSWSKDLIFAKAYSIFVEEQDPGIIECMTWCRKNRYTKFNDEDDN